MDDGECSSPATGGSAGLLPLFGRSPPAESLEGKIRRLSEDNRRLAGALDAILAGHPHLPVLSTAPATSSPGNAATRVTAEPELKVRTVCARVEPSDADANILKDDYQWRKYGQKVTRDNPYPRAYFRCAYAPSCPVKKKVQRSAEDRSMLVATYEGEHNHPPCAHSELATGSASQVESSSPCSISINSLGQTITLGLASQGQGLGKEVVSAEVVTPEFRKVLVDELVDLLKNDAEFMQSLTTAVTTRMLEKISSDRILQ
ncbi:hypothetical protein ACP4OV_024012 [Aristida adscensionis]